MKALLGSGNNIPVLRIVSLLVLTGFLVNAASFREIRSAIRNEDFAQVQSMISTDGGAKSDTAALCLMVAALEDKRSIMEKLLDEGVPINASPVYAREAGETPLTYAVFGTHEEIVAFLLKHGANPNYRGDCQFRDCAGLMPLDLTVKFGLDDITRQLLEAGADPNAGRNSAVRMANEQGRVKIFQLLTAHGGRLPADYSAAGSAVQSRRSATGSANDSAIGALGLSELLPASSSSSVSPEIRKRCRLAVIADDANVAAADILVARLSGRASLELIERQEADRIFAEKQLTREFASRQANYNSVAALLRADALLLIRTRDVDQQKVIEARFIRVHPGIVLDTVYHSAPLTDIKTWVEEMSGRVADLAAKAIRENGIALSILDVHSALPTSAIRGFERTLSVLLRDRLVHNPRFIVLERSELERAAFENAGEKPFWTGSYLVDPLADIALNNGDGFTLSVHLQPADKGRAAIIATVSGRRSQPTRVIDELMQRINVAVGGEDSIPLRPDPLLEAKSYTEEARWALAAKMPARAEAAADVAWALGLQTLEIAHLRLSGAEGAVQDELSTERTGGEAEALDTAIEAVGIWDDVLQGGLLRDHPDEVRPWLESISDLTLTATLAITSVKPATAQIEQAQRLGTLRKSYWTALRDARARSSKLPPGSGLPEKFSATQLRMAQLMLPDADELKAAFQEVLSRHFAGDDAAARASLRLGMHWRCRDVTAMNASGSWQIKYGLPENESVGNWLLEYLRQSSPEDRFIASAIDFEGPAILPADQSATLMANFWDMREDLARNEELFKLYFARLHDLIENEPMDERGYTPRVYQLRLAQDGSGERKSMETTQFEFYGQLGLYFLNHATRAESEFSAFATRYVPRYSAELRQQLQEAYNRYAARVGTQPVSFDVAQPLAPMPAPAKDLPCLGARVFWHPFDLGQHIAPEFALNSGTMQWREGRLWVLGHAQQYDEPKVHHYLFSIEIPSMHTDTIELPVGLPPGKAYDRGSWLPAESAFALTPDWVLLTVRNDFFGVYDRSRREWELYRELKPSSGPMLSQGGVYFEVEDSTAVVRFDLKSRSTRLLASTRRKPAESPLDNPNLSLMGVWTNGAGEVVVTARQNSSQLQPGAISSQTTVAPANEAFLTATWSPIRNEWRVSQSLAKAPPPDRGLLVSAGSVIRMTPIPRGGGGVAIRSLTDGTTWLSLRLNEPAVPLKSIPLELAVGNYANLPESRYGKPTLNVVVNANCYRCPEGYIVPPPFSPGFWFISREEFESYVSANKPPNEVANPQSHPASVGGFSGITHR